ncbi:MAG TPA: rubredoxin [Firmicutes bacterium]|nr:rubredoxin [Candidatus Fermentithermobacillaceae bacterium]
MAKHQCEVCSYVYDPEIGNPSDVKPGTSFDDTVQAMKQLGPSPMFHQFWARLRYDIFRQRLSYFIHRVFHISPGMLICVVSVDKSCNE